jgi:hypothetical protein
LKFNIEEEEKVMNKIKLEKPKTDGTRSFWLSRLTFVMCFFVSVGLIVGGFFVPPMGVIDGSVLTAVGELLLFPTLLYGYRAVELGMKVKFQKGETTVSVGKEDAE